jgi:K(+)-stimulated pyrophosphate-energized sodium pump
MYQSILFIITWATPLFGLVAFALAYSMYTSIKALPAGNARMQEISEAIRSGAIAYLKQQAQYLLFFVLCAFLVIWWALKLPTAVAFAFGAASSLLAGYLGMRAATMANVRTAHAASENAPGQALMVAFNGGAVMGLTVAALGLIGVGVLFIIYGTPAHHEPIIGFAMGASSVALFARVGGGIYTKAADVGSDLVGKVEAGIPEDDPRNPGVIADNVGDNVGDVAGMGADIFESYVTCLIGCLALAATLGVDQVQRLTEFNPNVVGRGEESYRIWLMVTPLALGLLGALSSFIAIKWMALLKDGDPANALRMTVLLASVFFVIACLGLVIITPVNLSLWLPVVFGTVCGIGIGLTTEYYTSSKPVYEIVTAAKTGPATAVISGIAVGFRSVALPLIIIVGAVLVSN